MHIAYDNPKIYIVKFLISGDQIASLSLRSLGSFASRTGILPSAFPLRVEPLLRVLVHFTQPKIKTGQVKNRPVFILWKRDVIS